MSAIATAQLVDSFTLPAEVYELATSWNPQPEIDRMLFLAREAGVTPLTALELGCGAGRLMRAFRTRGVGVCGIDLSERLIARARADGLESHVEDMSNFDMQRSFDLIYASANTIRHIVDASGWERTWNCIARNLPAGGIFIADLELGATHFFTQAGKPQVWIMSAGEAWVRSSWTIVEPPSPLTGSCGMEWRFEHRDAAGASTYRLAFPLRCDDAADFVGAGLRAGLSLVGIFENRDPFLIPRPVDRAEGRMLVMFRKP